MPGGSVLRVGEEVHERKRSVFCRGFHTVEHPDGGSTDEVADIVDVAVGRHEAGQVREGRVLVEERRV